MSDQPNCRNADADECYVIEATRDHSRNRDWERFVRDSEHHSNNDTRVGRGGERDRGGEGRRTPANNGVTRGYIVPGIVPHIKQPKDNVCWATAATIMVSWKNNVLYNIENVVSMAGSIYLSRFQSNQGLDSQTEVPGFLNALGIITEPPMNYSLNEWQNLLQNNGPLWVNVLDDPNKPWAAHSVVLDGISGDFSTNTGTYFHFVDPADGQGRPQDVETFINRYENISRATPNLIFQVYHFRH